MKTNKTVKFIFACVLTLSLVLSSFVFAPLSASAATTAVWDGTIASGFAGGTGTADDPYQISNGAQLAYLASKSATFELDTRWKYYILTNDIVLNDTSSSNWKETATQWIQNSKGFNGWGFGGTFNGNGHTVSGLYITGALYGGLFPKIDAGATIRNLGIINSYVSGTNVGAFVGATCVGANASSNNTTNFVYCYADETVEVNGTNVGGFVGAGQVIYKFTNCYFTGNLTGTKSKFGAAVGDTWWANGGLGDVYVDGCYTTVSKWLNPYAEKNTNSYKGVTATGEDAKTAMPNLNWTTVYKSVNGKYPAIRKFLPNDIWNGSIAERFAGGSGTAADPYQISNGSELYYLVMIGSGANASLTSGKYYVLTNDIVLNDTSASNWKNSAQEWYSANLTQPASSWGFRGTLDGQEHTISGLYISGKSNAGLFPMLDGSSSIKNVGIINSYLNGTYAGAFGGTYGYANGTGTITLTNCFADSTVTVTATDTAGGLIGFGANYVKMTNCYFAGSVSGTSKTGGLVGHVWWAGSCGDFRYTNCYTTASNYISALSDLNKPTAPNYCGVTATGIDAKTAMPNLDWSIYKVKADNYPVLRAFDTENSSALWNGFVPASLTNGTGTMTDPYKIATAGELAYVAKNLGTTRGKYYELTNDITINDTSESNWTDTAAEWPSKITVDANFNVYNSYQGLVGFGGVLNGNGHTISGIYVNGGTGGGLFTVINGGATIYNLNIDNSSITSNMAGAFGGYAKTHSYSWNGSAFVLTENLGNIRIANCTVRDGVTVNGINGAGGFIGCVTNTFDANSADNNIIFGNCGAFATVTATAAGLANGFIGENYQGGFYVNNSFCFGNVARSGRDPVSVNLMINQNANTIKDAAALNALYKFDFVNTWKATAGGYPVLTTAIKHNGDVSLDGVVDATDLSELVAHILGIKNVVNTNVNKDSTTNILDLVALKKLIAGVNSMSNTTVTLNGKTYSYVWGSEFDGNSLDTSKFAYTADMSASGNLSLVKDSLAYADVKDGNLVLTAKKDGDTYKSAGCIGTPSKMHYKYGYAEIRAKVPFGTATFPAFWAKSVNMGKGYLDDGEYGVEIDVFEQHETINTVASNVHKWVKAGASMTSTNLGIGKPTTTVSTTNEYHTYGFEWYEGMMKFYVDGVCIGSYNYSTGTNPNIQDFDGQIYLILDNMIETAKAGDSFNNTFEIDYIRLYQNASDNGSLTVF